MRLRSCANTRNTYRIWNRRVGTVKKSTDTKLWTWFSRKVRQVCDGGFRLRTRYFTHAGFADIDTKFQQLAMNARSTPVDFRGSSYESGRVRPFGTGGRPRLPRRIFQDQKR